MNKMMVLGALAAGMFAPVGIASAETSTVAKAIQVDASAYDGRYDRYDGRDRRDGRRERRSTVLSIDRVLIELRRGGYSDFDGFRDRGDCYFGRARHPSGYYVTLEVDRQTARVIRAIRIADDRRDRRDDRYDRRDRRDDRYDRRDRRDDRYDRRDRRDDRYDRRSESDRRASAAWYLRNDGYLNVRYVGKSGRSFVFLATERRGRVIKFWIDEYTLQRVNYRVVRA